ncbi:MAG: hypothetical protein ACRDF7_01285 [Candidatus Limnocylindrales bacterium]
MAIWPLFRFSRWALTTILLVLPLAGVLTAGFIDVFDAITVAAFAWPLAIAIGIGTRTGPAPVARALGIVPYGLVIVLALVVIFIEPWTQLQFMASGGPVLYVLSIALAVIGLAAVLLAPSDLEDAAISSSNRTLASWGLIGAFCVTQLGLAGLLLFELQLSTSDCPEGPCGLAVPIFVGPSLMVVLATLVWLSGVGWPAVVIDGLLAIWAGLILNPLVGSELASDRSLIPIAIVQIGLAIIGVAIVLFSPAGPRLRSRPGRSAPPT